MISPASALRPWRALPADGRQRAPCIWWLAASKGVYDLRTLNRCGLPESRRLHRLLVVCDGLAMLLLLATTAQAL